MKFISKLAMGMFIALNIVSCSKNDDSAPQYSGENRVYITAKGDKVLTLGEANQKIEAKFSLTTKVNADTAIHLKVVDAQGQTSDLVSLSANPIIIAKEAREATFTLTLKANASITEEQRLKVTFEPVTGLIAQEDLAIVVKPSAVVMNLTPAQRQLLNAYKAKGIDLYPFMGKVKVTGTIFSPAGGNAEPFVKEFTREINGSTLITLSALATSDSPVLKMTDNPMGLTEFWLFLLRKNTVEDTEFFPASPVAKAIMPLINWNKDSKETFGVTLDNIKIGSPTNGVSQIEFIHKTKDLYDDLTDMVPFQFTYSAYDRFKKLVDEGNPIAIENNGQAGGPNPIYYLNTTNILSDKYEKGAWKASTGSINFTEKKMSFEFLISHEYGGDYIIVKIEYIAQ